MSLHVDQYNISYRVQSNIIYTHTHTVLTYCNIIFYLKLISYTWLDPGN